MKPELHRKKVHCSSECHHISPVTSQCACSEESRTPCGWLQATSTLPRLQARVKKHLVSSGSKMRQLKPSLFLGDHSTLTTKAQSQQYAQFLFTISTVSTEMSQSSYQFAWHCPRPTILVGIGSILKLLGITFFLQVVDFRLKNKNKNAVPIALRRGDPTFVSSRLTTTTMMPFVDVACAISQSMSAKQ